MSFRPKKKASEDGFSFYAKKRKCEELQVFGHHCRTTFKFCRLWQYYPEKIESIHCYVSSSEKIPKSTAYDKSL